MRAVEERKSAEHDMARARIEDSMNYVDEKSDAVRRFTLAPATLEKFHAATSERIAAFEMKFNKEEARRLEEMWWERDLLEWEKIPGARGLTE